ncbi:hypothetical protein BJP34_12835 [Moorena producens PAL-8-15-08-1]|uniref:Uncharacterized protein n=1 Tax=Moorena producens PAL-8-15-08-1 TaxID=1458985 RepID=A0A1D8TRI7_9CYAN|nr:hypothetical protein BJP34_12835 [Moorena producens PAL-8-15-08-1]
MLNAVGACQFCGVAELRNECAIIWCMLKPPLVPQLWGTCLDAVAHGGNPQDRAASLERLIPPKIGGLGGQNHT